MAITLDDLYRFCEKQVVLLPEDAPLNEAIRLGTKEGSGIAVKAPFVNLKKKDIVRMGVAMGVPFEHSWSCYREERKACGVCDSCALRLRAFAEADAVDPLPYETRPDYR